MTAQSAEELQMQCKNIIKTCTMHDSAVSRRIADAMQKYQLALQC
jgi:hypothetical protein